MDAFRLDFVRRINMYVNSWHGCPELLCRRNRGCMAPNIQCSNVAPQPPEEADREWRQAKPEIYKTVKAHLARHAAEVAELEAQEEANAEAKAEARGAKGRDKQGPGVS